MGRCLQKKKINKKTGSGAYALLLVLLDKKIILRYDIKIYTLTYTRNTCIISTLILGY